jgi:hypothetical protein
MFARHQASAQKAGGVDYAPLHEVNVAKIFFHGAFSITHAQIHRDTFTAKIKKGCRD